MSFGERSCVGYANDEHECPPYDRSSGFNPHCDVECPNYRWDGKTVPDTDFRERETIDFSVIEP